MADDFWAVIRSQWEQLTRANGAEDVARILAKENNPYVTVLGDTENHGGGDGGFFAGGGGDLTVWEALRAAGWRILWAEAEYYFAMQAPDGSIITYCEGDIYKRDVRQPA